MHCPLWTKATHQGQPSKLSEKKSVNPLKLSFQGKGEVFTEVLVLESISKYPEILLR